MSLNDLRDDIQQWAKEKGWEDHEKYPDRTFGDLIALMHSELSEALEEHRHEHKPTEVYCFVGFPIGEAVPFQVGQKPEGIPIEFADCIIRILQACGKYGIDIDEAVRLKMEYNRTRPERHGGRTI
jgi:NTP pyrophosphatase (non-canonical NTP hydrolase)